MSYEDVARMIKRLRWLALNDNDLTSGELLRAVNAMNELAGRLGAAPYLI